MLIRSSFRKEILLAHKDVLKRGQTLPRKVKRNDKNAKCHTNTYFPGE